MQCLKFPSEDLHQSAPVHRNSINKDDSNDENDTDDQEFLEPVLKKSKRDHRSNRLNPTTNQSFSSLKHLYLRNIRNIKSMTFYQSSSLKSFVQFQHNLNTLDLIGLYLSSQFIESILVNLNNLK